MNLWFSALEIIVSPRHFSTWGWAIILIVLLILYNYKFNSPVVQFYFKLNMLDKIPFLTARERRKIRDFYD